MRENVFLLSEKINNLNQSNQLISIKNATLPILFLQLGSKTSLFFDEVLQQAVLSNGKENVFILTDTNFELYRQYNCIDISDYTHTNRIFDKLYHHHSTNSYFFEKTCFDRWFIINDFITDHSIDHFFYADCDVLILNDLKPVYENFIMGKYDGSTMFFQYGENSVTSAHTSFWNAKLLTDFCKFINTTYANSQAFDAILKDTQEGKFLDNRNVSDMILLDVFRTQTKPNTLNLLLLEGEGICFDFNVNVSFNGNKHSYVISNITHIKKLTRYKNSIYGCVEQTGSKKTYVNFCTLHFQGYLTKTLIPCYITPQNNSYVSNNLKGINQYATRRIKMLKNSIKAFIKK